MINERGVEWVYEVKLRLPSGYRICRLKPRFEQLMEHLPTWILHRKATINKDIGPIKFRNCIVEYQVWPKPLTNKRAEFEGCTAYLNEGLLTRHALQDKNTFTYCEQCGMEFKKEEADCAN